MYIGNYDAYYAKEVRVNLIYSNLIYHTQAIGSLTVEDLMDIVKNLEEEGVL